MKGFRSGLDIVEKKKPPASEGNRIPGSSVPWPTRCRDCCYPRSMRDSSHNGAVHIMTSFCRPRNTSRTGNWTSWLALFSLFRRCKEQVPGFSTRNIFFLPYCAFRFRMFRTVKSDCILFKYHYLPGLCNEDPACFLWGRSTILNSYLGGLGFQGAWICYGILSECGS